ncbi:MAG: acetoacetate decarboxylase family protein [Clostridiales bacterium]|nr:acetoacetate decarboxylase family protein [Clostridiales bacterium]
MSNYSFFTPYDEIYSSPDSVFSKGCEMRNEEGIFVCCETKMEILRRIVPPCFEIPAAVVNFYIINMPDNNFGLGYNECAMIIPVTYNGEPGIFFRSHFLNSKKAFCGPFGGMVGRELAGFPKKPCDDITLVVSENRFHGFCVKDGVRFLDIEAELGEYNTPAGKEIYHSNETGEKTMGTMYLIKWDLEEGEDGRCEFRNARLLSNYADSTYTSWTPATAKVTLRSTANAPWAEVEITKVLAAGYGSFQNINSSVKFLTELDSKEIMQYMMKSHYDVGFYKGFSERRY